MKRMPYDAFENCWWFCTRSQMVIYGTGDRGCYKCFMKRPSWLSYDALKPWGMCISQFNSGHKVERPNNKHKILTTKIVNGREI